MKFKTLSAMCLAATSVFAASSAMAWESEDGAHSTSANVGLYSDYLFRGISFSDDKPAIQGGFDYAHSSGLYLGTWASNLSILNDDDETSETNIEIDIYGGFASEFGESGIGYDLGMVRYIYPGTNSDQDIDYNEYYGGLSYSYFSAMVFYTDDWGNTGEDEIYYKLGFDYDLPYGLALSAHYGYTDSDRNDGTNLSDSYSDYGIGLTKGFAGLDWSVGYYGTDSDGEDFAATEDNADDRFLISVSSSF
jgi:uncharacterized protein (TIGR02001 family)